MLLSGGRTVATLSDQNVVLDTIMLAKSGDPLLSPSAVATLRGGIIATRFH